MTDGCESLVNLPMKDGELTRVTISKAADASAGPGRALSDEAGALLTDALTPESFLDLLIAAGRHVDAETFLARVLPKREAVWWAAQCVRLAVGPEPKPEVAEALRAAEEWAAVPGDANRRKAFTAAEAAGLGHPAGCTALAAFLSGGSLAPPKLPDVPPADHLTADCVASALQIAAVLNDPAKAPDHHRAFLDVGLDVARGKDRWKDRL